MSRWRAARILGAGCVVAAGAAALTWAAQQPQCSTRERVAALLTKGFGETLRQTGIADSGRMLEVYASAATGTWTVVLTSAAGTSCMLSSGGAYSSATDDPA